MLKWTGVCNGFLEVFRYPKVLFRSAGFGGAAFCPTLVNTNS